MSKVQLITQLIHKQLFTSCVFCNQMWPDYLEVDTISLPSPPRLRDPVSSISSISSSSLSSFLMTTTGGGLCSERGCRWGDTIPPFPIDTRWKWYKSCHPLMLWMTSVNWALVVIEMCSLTLTECIKLAGTKRTILQIRILICFVVSNVYWILMTKWAGFFLCS